jgi:hypothetical protein
MLIIRVKDLGYENNELRKGAWASIWCPMERLGWN